MRNCLFGLISLLRSFDSQKSSVEAPRGRRHSPSADGVAAFCQQNIAGIGRVTFVLRSKCFSEQLSYATEDEPAVNCVEMDSKVEKSCLEEISHHVCDEDKKVIQPFRFFRNEKSIFNLHIARRLEDFKRLEPLAKG